MNSGFRAEKNEVDAETLRRLKIGVFISCLVLARFKVWTWVATSCPRLVRDFTSVTTLSIDTNSDSFSTRSPFIVLHSTGVARSALAHIPITSQPKPILTYSATSSCSMNRQYWSVRTASENTLQIPWNLPEFHILYNNTIPVDQPERLWHVSKAVRKDGVQEVFRL